MKVRNQNKQEKNPYLTEIMQDRRKDFPKFLSSDIY